MHIVTDTDTGGSPPAIINNSARRVGGGVVNGLTWTAYGVGFEFCFRVEDDQEREVHTSPAEFPTAPKAERAAKEWCNAYVPAAPDLGGVEQPVTSALETGPEPTEAAPVPAVMVQPGEEVVAGWVVTIDAHNRGFDVVLLDLWTGDAAEPESLSGTFETREGAAEAGRVWAEEHPTEHELERRRGLAEPTPEIPTPFDGPGDEPPADQAPAAEAAPSEPTPAPAVTRDEEMEQLRRERDQARRERDAAYATAAADFLEATAEAEELLELAEKKQHWLGVIEDAKLELKLIEKKLGGKADSVARRIQGIGRGERGQAYQQRLFANSAETREVVGGEARKVVERLSRPESILDTAKAAGMEIASHAWPYNGVEHHIEHEATAMGPCITAWIRGHRQYTEGHGETYEQAVESCKSAAAIYFENCDPGETKPSEDAGAVADGPRKPAKRGKAKLKGHDQAAVLAAIARTADTVAASIDLGCSPFQLQKYAEKQGLTLKLPAPPPAKASKPRGRRAKGGAG